MLLSMAIALPACKKAKAPMMTCAVDGECAELEVCVDGMYKALACNMDTQCQAPQVCIDGMCR